MLSMVESQEDSIQWSVTRNTWTKLGEQMQEQETHNSPEYPRMVESITPQGSQK